MNQGRVAVTVITQRVTLTQPEGLSWQKIRTRFCERHREKGSNSQRSPGRLSSGLAGTFFLGEEFPDMGAAAGAFFTPIVAFFASTHGGVLLVKTVLINVRLGSLRRVLR
jgi:hypothetical protein